MSGNGAVWGRVRSRLRAFPECLAACGAEAAAYGRGVQASMAPGGHLRKDLCAQEFQALRSCFAAAVSGRPHPDPPPSPVSGKGPAGLLSLLLRSVLGARWFFRPTSPRDARRYGASA
ncbi:hypothetical protein PAL_GLEAN10014555 [Pteropus alecto]|uniref:NADH dehydrogenase [ubiquinone] 1 alpha subcomplex assembly factor 8 n=1 Tax=Pteropus alecto TaxID=9402 RepID=L5KNQ2_PTEAL|nr:hypothetical protein PAL_GLEAN10014555 [Pteropus alecto]